MLKIQHLLYERTNHSKSHWAVEKHQAFITSSRWQKSFTERIAMPKCVVWLPRRLFARDKSISHNKQFHNVHSVSESRQLNGILGAIRVGIQLKRGHILYQFYDTLPPVSACVRADGVERWISISSGTFSGMSSIFRVILRFFSSFRFIYANCVSACHPVRRGKSQKPTPEKKMSYKRT